MCPCVSRAQCVKDLPCVVSLQIDAPIPRVYETVKPGKTVYFKKKTTEFHTGKYIAVLQGDNDNKYLEKVKFYLTKDGITHITIKSKGLAVGKYHLVCVINKKDSYDTGDSSVEFKVAR